MGFYTKVSSVLLSGLTVTGNWAAVSVTNVVSRHSYAASAPLMVGID